MASAITHFVVGAALAWPAVEWRAIRNFLSPRALLVSCGLIAAAPDLDTFSMRAFDSPYNSLFGHRGFFHSPFFLIVATGVLAWIAARRYSRATLLGVWLVWAGAAITHPLLDMLTDGGLGVMLLFPFSRERLFFPWHPIHVSPLVLSRFFDNAGYILRSELPFCAAAIGMGAVGQIAGAHFRSGKIRSA